MSLYDTQCKNADPKTKPYKLFDNGGLYLEVLPSGVKSWRQKYRFHGKEKRICHGLYPAISLLEAREKTKAAKVELRNGRDPILVRLEQEQIASLAQSQIFEDVAREWHSQQLGHWSEKYAQAVLHHLEKYVFPELGSYPLTTITPFIVLSCLKKIEKTNPEMTRRMKAIISHIYKYSIATCRATTDPTYGLEAALKKFRRGHYSAITVDEFPTFIIRLYEYRDRISRQTFLATLALLLTMVRTAELIEAKRTEFNLENKMWIIPPERMKMGLPHMVPLSRQMVEIVKELFTMNSNSEYLLPSYYRPRKPMCKNTILVAIKRMGYNGRMTGHGFRSLGLGLCKEKLGYSHEVADRQLAHVPKDSVDRAYDRAQFLPQRTGMMQAYADYIDKVYLEELSKKIAV